MLIKFIVALAVIIVMFAAFVATRPDEFRVTRSATIAAPAPVVFAHVNELRKWEAWSPWAKKDPQMKQTYEGGPAGTGAVTLWAGNREVGEGRMTIVESRPDEFVRIKLEFFKPFTATNAAEFTFKPEGNRTAVTWSMNGQNNFIAKAMHLFFDVDKMVGGDFEAGLANLKTVTEK